MCTTDRGYPGTFRIQFTSGEIMIDSRRRISQRGTVLTSHAKLKEGNPAHTPSLDLEQHGGSMIR
jgi:hypothetical protein